MEPRDTARAQEREGRRFGAAWTTALLAGFVLAAVVLLIVWLA